jgi:nucleotide-binding universal stress UspA family protein
MEPVVTVGLDGSPESLAAARWAADEAERRKLTLRLLHAWPLLVPEPTRIPAEMDQNYWARRIVHNTRAELQAHHPGLPVVGSLVADDAEHALLRAASESEMIVLGSRGLMPVESYFLGDISMPVVARRAKTPHSPLELRQAAWWWRSNCTDPATICSNSPSRPLLREACLFGPSTAGACR